MAWQEIDIANAKINMSKVVPYDETLSILDKKQGYYHNNRLTALNKWVTDSAVGYKCYKRKANPNNLVDGELTDYIEINKILENGSIDHMIDIADSYYKLEKEAHDDNSNLPEFVQGVVLDDTLIGRVEDWLGYSFYKLEDNHYIAYNNLTDEMFNFTTNGSKSSITINYTKQYIAKKSEGGFFKIENRFYFMNYSSLNNMLSQLNKNIENTHDAKMILDGDNNEAVTKTWDTAFPIKIFGYIYTCTILNKNNITNACFNWEVKRSSPGNVNRTITFDICEYKYVQGDYLPNVSNKIQSILTLEIESKASTYYNNIYRIISYNSQIHSYIKGNFFDESIVSGFDQLYSYSAGKTAKYSLKINANLTLAKLGQNISTNFNFSMYQKSEIVKVDEKDTNFEKAYNKKSDIIETIKYASNYVNDSVFTNNGFVVNYTNKLPVTLGHKYKVIARLDTQGASYLGSDNKYSYISQNGEMYKISVEKMFPDVAYDEEVNIIENADYCQQVNGYKIFNTTTYYNAIYNDDKNKVICSCDDWNGRYKSNSATLSNATLKSTSRVGNFWNSTQSWTDIPNKAISDELNDILEIENPTYSWTNPNYTIHEGTEAYIYTQNNNQVDTMYQQWVVEKDGFRRDYKEDKQFIHNKPLQLVPSILFSHYLKSDVENIISIGSESYRLKTYAYSTTTPALVYQSIAESININPDSEEMVLQGSYYVISGSKDRRLITNPYDTSTTTYCCDVTGLKYIGYDSVQGYFYSPSTATIYTFNGANKLNAYLEVDNRIPMTSADKDGITVCNIPSINLVAMAFFDGVLLIINQQSVFIPVQNIQSLSANREYGIVRIGSSYYYFGTNSNIKSLIASTGGKSIIKVETLPPASSVEDKDNVVYLVTTTEKYYVVEKVFEPTISYKWTETTLDSLIGSSITDKLIFKTSKIGFDRKTNATMSKQRLCVYSDNLEKGVVKVTITSRLGNKINTEIYTKTIQPKEFIDNEFQWEFNQKFTKANWFTIECELDNLDLLNHYVEMSESTEENLVR